MKVHLKTPIYGYEHGCTVPHRKLADAGDTLDVILNNKSHFICNSNGITIVVFPSQCEEIVMEQELKAEDKFEFEKYYHVYEEPCNKNLDDPFHTAFENNYDE